MKEHVVRGSFSSLAAAVFAATSAEWALWAAEERRPWKFIPSAVLAVFAIYEVAKIWKRVDTLIDRVT